MRAVAVSLVGRKDGKVTDGVQHLMKSPSGFNVDGRCACARGHGACTGERRHEAHSIWVRGGQQAEGRGGKSTHRGRRLVRTGRTN